jgi:hypothetical protein
LPYIPDLVARKLSGPEKSKLEDADIAFHESEYQRLRTELQSAHDASTLPELPGDETRDALLGIAHKDFDLEVYGVDYETRERELSAHTHVRRAGA